jgi:tetratricopeptide (TPR) repeat protein
MKAMFADNPHYVEYETRLKELHDLIGEGKGDSDEADEVRDAMDLPYRQLTREEVDRLRGLSADLYMLQDDEIFQRFDGTQEELRAALQDAWKKQDWERLLGLLRKGPDSLSREGLASLRATAYQGLGHLDTALMFEEYAAQLNPQDTDRKVLILDLLYRLNRREEATALARSIIADPKASSNLLAYAGYILSLTASSVTEEQGENSFATAPRRITSKRESLVTAK